MNAPLLVRSGDALTYPLLVAFKRRGLRNRNWARLNITEKALFKCGLWITRVRGEINNTKLMVQILRITLKLAENVRSKILKVGRKRVLLMSKICQETGVFKWAPQVKRWLVDDNYIRYLGVLAVNG